MDSIHCIRFGEVVFDENRRLYILCKNCNSDFGEVQEFRTHLETCTGAEHFLHGLSKKSFKNKSGKIVFAKVQGTIKKYKVYDPKQISHVKIEETYHNGEEEDMDLLQIEEEIHDARWYNNLTDIKNSAEELSKTNGKVKHIEKHLKSNINALKARNISDVIKKTPIEVMANKYVIKTRRINGDFESPNKSVQFSVLIDPETVTERVTLVNKKPIKDYILQSLPSLNANKSSTETASKRSVIINDRLLKDKIGQTTVNLTGNNEIKLIPYIKTGKQKQQPAAVGKPWDKKRTFTSTLTNSSSNTLRQLEASISKEKQTEEILNKLNSLGLQIKRKHTPKQTEDYVKNPDIRQLVQKLKSKGMDVKILKP